MANSKSLKEFMFSRLGFSLLFFLNFAQAEEIPRPAFSRERQFVFLPAQPAKRLNLGSPAEGFLFDEASAGCGVAAKEVQFRLSQILNRNESAVIGSLQKYFGHFSEEKFQGLRVLVDYFGIASSHFRSLYVPPQKNMPATISIDCDSHSRRVWSGMMAHEMVHHLNRDQNLSVWVDEMLAQVLEVDNSPDFPEPRIQKLASNPVTASFFTDQSVFHSSEQYASNLLFGLYLRQLFGIQVFKEFRNSVYSLDDLSERLIAYADQRGELDWLRGYLTPKSLIRHFHLALSLNAPILNGGSVFIMPRWQGFQKSSELSQGQVRLEPGSSVRLISAFALKLPSLPPGIEVYRILKSGHRFKILKLTEQPHGSWDSDHLVLINTSQDQSFDLLLPQIQ